MAQFSATAQGAAGIARLIVRNFSPHGGIYCAFSFAAMFKALLSCKTYVALGKHLPPAGRDVAFK
jgi:hypothetical protein